MQSNGTLFCCFALIMAKKVTDCVCSLSIPDVTLPRLKAFIPQLLSRLHIETLLHGNITKQVSWKHGKVDCVRCVRGSFTAEGLLTCD